jgi:hypothetical protein
MKKLICILTISLMVIYASAQTKNQPKKDSTIKVDPTDGMVKMPQSNYFIIGQLDAFKLLAAAVTAPDDVTANQRKALMEWLNKNLQALPTDTTGNKKKN